jgi:carbon monoxide dehydrogenase subunit G
MARISGEVTIDAPVEEVFDLVADERNEPRYNPRIVRAEKVSEGPVSRGARFVAEPKGMGAKGQMTLEVLQYDRPHRLRTVVRSSYMQVEGTVTFEEVDGGTRLRWDWDMGLVGALRVLSPVLAAGTGWASRSTWSPIAAEPVHHDRQYPRVDRKPRAVTASCPEKSRARRVPRSSLAWLSTP